MRRRHLKALSSDEFPSDGFRRSGTIGLPDCTNEAAFTKAFRAGCDSPSLGGLTLEDSEENFKICRKSVGKFHVMPDKNFI